MEGGDIIRIKVVPVELNHYLGNIANDLCNCYRGGGA